MGGWEISERVASCESGRGEGRLLEGSLGICEGV